MEQTINEPLTTPITTENRVVFEETNTFFDTVKVGEKVELTWKFSGDKEDIIHVQPSCGCTAEVKISDNTITAIYTADTEDVLKRRYEVNGNTLEKSYPSGKVPVVKSLVVYMNDGKDLKVLNERGFEIFNQDKLKEVINFNGYINYK